MQWKWGLIISAVSALLGLVAAWKRPRKVFPKSRPIQPTHLEFDEAFARAREALSNEHLGDLSSFIHQYTTDFAPDPKPDAAVEEDTGSDTGDWGPPYSGAGDGSGDNEAPSVGEEAPGNVPGEP